MVNYFINFVFSNTYKTRLLLFSLFLLNICLLNAEKVLVITTAYNRPEFIEWQDMTFQKFIEDEYEFIVYNDASDPLKNAEIHNMCSSLGVRCIDVPQNLHKINAPSHRNCTAVQFALNDTGFSHNGIVWIIDSDMFLTRKFNVEKYCKNFPIVGLSQYRKCGNGNIDYLWIGIVFLDMRTLPDKNTINFGCGNINGVGVDSGGFTHYYLNAHRNLNVKYFSNIHSNSLVCPACSNSSDNRLHNVCLHNTQQLKDYGLDDMQVDAMHCGLRDVEFLIEGTFIHYRSGTNWHNETENYHKNKATIFKEYLSKILAQPN